MNSRKAPFAQEPVRETWRIERSLLHAVGSCAAIILLILVITLLAIAIRQVERRNSGAESLPAHSASVSFQTLDSTPETVTTTRIR
jgi:hypothetical protein